MPTFISALSIAVLWWDKASAFEYATMGKERAFVELLSSAQIDHRVKEEKEEEGKALQEKVAQAHAPRGKGAVARYPRLRAQFPDYFATQSAEPFTLAAKVGEPVGGDFSLLLSAS
jgi:hypothetical protein